MSRGAAEGRTTSDAAEGRRTSRTVERRWSATPLLAWGIWLIGAATLVAVLLLASEPGSRALGDLNLFVVVFLGTVVTYSTVGAAIAARRPDHYAGWMLLATGVLFGLIVLCIGYASSTEPPASPRAGAAWTAWAASWGFETLLGGMAIFFLLLFPDGRLPSPRWRPVAGLAFVSLLAFAIGTALDPSVLAADYPWLSSPIDVQPAMASLAGGLALVGNAGIVVTVVLAGWSLVWRYRRSDTTVRLQIKWVAYVGVGMAIAFSVASLQIGTASEIAWLIGLTLVAALPLAVAFAILRYRLLEIDRLISRTFVYGALTAILAGLYAASLRLFQGLFVAFTGNESDAALVLTTLVLATTLTPMKLRLEGFAGRHLADGPTASRVPEEALERPFSLDDPAAVAALEAIVERVVQRDREPA